MRFYPLLLSLLVIFSLTGCETLDNVKNSFSSAIDEIVEAYQNVTGKVTDTKDWVEEKVDKTQKAAEDVQEAAESINQAVDSIKDLTGGDSEAEKSPITETLVTEET